MERFARLASALAGTHPGTETVPRTVSNPYGVCPFRISLFIKSSKHKNACCFLAQMERFARLASALAGTHPGTETVPRTVSNPYGVCPFRISLFIKKQQAQKCLLFFGADGEIRTLAAVAHPTPLAGAPRHQLEYICKTVTLTHSVKLSADSTS